MTCLAVALMAKLEKFLSFIGALVSTPLAVTIPVMVHYKLSARTKYERMIDIGMAVFSAWIILFSMKQTI